MWAHMKMMPRIEAGEMLAAINVAVLAQQPQSRGAQSQRTKALKQLEQAASGGQSKGSGVDLAKMSPEGRSRFLESFGITAVNAGEEGSDG